MKIWFDTEFIENGSTIDLISIGMVREDGATYYAQNSDCDLSKASPWVRENVIPHLQGFDSLKHMATRRTIAADIVEFAGDQPEFWAYFSSYDWVALCQLYGTMMNLPTGWPMFCLDVQQLSHMLFDPQLPKQSGTEHHALADAQWTYQTWLYLNQVMQSRLREWPRPDFLALRA